MGSQQCPICQESIKESGRGSNSGYWFYVTCPRCGKYQIGGSAHGMLSDDTEFDPRIKANISGWLRENQNFEIDSNNIKQLKTIKTPSFHERADKLLISFEKMTNFAGEILEDNISWLSIGYCLNRDELGEILDYLSSIDCIHDIRTSGSHSIKICPDGWAHLEELKKVNIDSQQCFVAMWFDPEMQGIYDNYISEAIYEAGYRPHRVDQREHNNKIDDEIIAQIRRSRFVLADFTGHRGGVYYEAGFAMGLGLEVFWT